MRILDKNKKYLTPFQHYMGFTLAEILITLGIIGIVSAMTIPSLIQGMEDHATVTALKKAYSTLSNAYKMAEQEYGTPDNWGLASTNPSKETLNKLKPYLNVTKDCIDGSNGCFPTGVTYKTLKPNGNDGIYDNASNPKLRLADGISIMGLGWGASPTCNTGVGSTPALQTVCDQYAVDINGDKKPNQLGKDLFWFYLTKYGIIPIGTEQDSTHPFSAACKDKDTAWGDSCSAWVIYNENLDYLHCNNLDWSTKTKCN